MRFEPKDNSAKDAYALWYATTGQSRDYIADINLNLFEDMKRFYVIDRRTGEPKRPFYTEEMQQAYDPVLNPQPHMNALQQNFKLAFILEQPIYLYNPGDSMPKKLAFDPARKTLYLKGLTEEEIRQFEPLQETRKREAATEISFHKLQNVMDFQDQSTDTYHAFYGKQRTISSSLKKRKYLSYEETEMFTKKNRTVVTSNDRKIKGNLTDDEFSLLTIAAVFTAGVSNDKDHPTGDQIYTASLNLDTLAVGRPDYGQTKITNAAHKAAEKAAADFADTNSDHVKIGKLLAEGIRNYAAAERIFSYSTKTSYLSDASIAALYPAVGFLNLLESRPELKAAAVAAGLQEDTLTQLKATANAYQTEMSDLHMIEELMLSKHKDLPDEKKKMEKILLDRILLQSFARQRKELEDSLYKDPEYLAKLAEVQMNFPRTHKNLKGQKSKDELAAELRKVHAEFYSRKLEYKLLKIEENLSDFRKIDYLRNELQKQESVQQEIQKFLDSCKSVDNMAALFTKSNAISLSEEVNKKIDELTNLDVTDKHLKQSSAQKYSTIKVPENRWERKQLIEKIRKPVAKMGITLDEDKVKQMVNSELSPELQKEARDYLHWADRQEHCLNSYGAYIQKKGKIIGGKRFVSFLLDASGTDDADKANKQLLDQLIVKQDAEEPSEGMKMQVLNICKEILTKDLSFFALPEDLTDPMKKIEYYKANCRLIQLAWVVKGDIVEHNTLKKYIPEGIHHAIVDRIEMLQSGVYYSEMLKAAGNDLSWLWANFSPEDRKKITNSDVYQKVDHLGWLTSQIDEENEAAEDDMTMQSSLTDFANSGLFNEAKQEIIPEKEIRKWTAEGKLSPYKRILYDGQPISVEQAMYKVQRAGRTIKEGKDVITYDSLEVTREKMTFELRSADEIEEIHDLIKGSGSVIDQQIYAEYQKSKGLNPSAPEEKEEEIINTDSVRNPEKENAAEEAENVQVQEENPPVPENNQQNVQEMQEAVPLENPVGQEPVNEQPNLQAENRDVQQPAEIQQAEAEEEPAAVQTNPEEISNLKAYLKELMKLEKALKHTDPTIGTAGTAAYTDLQNVLESQINILLVPEYLNAATMKNSLAQIAEQCDSYMFEHKGIPDLSSRQQNRLKFMNRLMDLKDYFDAGRKLDLPDEDTYRQIIAAKIVQSKAKYCQKHGADLVDTMDRRRQSLETTGRMLQVNRVMSKHAVDNLLKNDNIFEYMIEKAPNLKEMASQPGADLLKKYAKIKNLTQDVSKQRKRDVQNDEASRARERDEIKRLLGL